MTWTPEEPGTRLGGRCPREKNTILRPNRVALVGLALVVTAATGTASAAAHVEDDTSSSTSVALPGQWGDWTTVKPADNKPVNPKSRAYFRLANVKVTNNNLVIRSMRHCIAGKPTEKTKAHPAKCGSKENTKYSTGRVQKMLVPPNAGNWRVTFKAKMPQGAAAGTRSALWMLNTHGVDGYCKDKEVKSNFGEMDVLEWYSAKGREKTSTATTHLTCNGSTFISEGGARSFVGSPAAFHDWSVTRSGLALTYRMDKKIVLTQKCGKGKLTKVKDCKKILDSGWQAIMQGEVFKRGLKGDAFVTPDWTKPFPTISLVIRDVKFKPAS